MGLACKQEGQQATVMLEYTKLKPWHETCRSLEDSLVLPGTSIRNLAVCSTAEGQHALEQQAVIYVALYAEMSSSIV